MKRLLQEFWTWLTSPREGIPSKGHPDLYPIDVEKLRRELNLIDEAKRLGAAGLPAPDATVLSGPEAAVLQRVEKARQDYVDWAAMRANVLDQGIGKQNIAQDANRAAQQDKEFERKASTLLTDREGTLRALGETVIRRKQELEQFKTEHSLTRSAEYPSPTWTIVRYLALIALILVEGLCNAAFFAQGLDSGLLGGLAYAGMLAGANVIVAFMFGKHAVRYVNHHRPLLKVFGTLLTVTALAIMVSIGLGIAHYRDALTSEASDASRLALETLSANPTALHDFFSWALFGISIAFGIAALLDGLTIDDYYPGYGKMARRAQEAIDSYEHEIEGVQAQLEDLKNAELESLDKTVRATEANIGVLDTLINDKRTAGLRLSTALRDADNSLDALLRTFRTENELHRNGVPRPAYFEKLPSRRSIEMPSFETGTDEAMLEEQRKRHDELLADVEAIRARIQAAFNQQFDRLKPLDLHFSSGDGR